MLAILVALSLGQAPVVTPSDAPVAEPAPNLSVPPPPPLHSPVPELQPNRLGLKPGFFSAPRVSSGTLVGRVGMGLVLGSVVGGTLAAGFLGLGLAFASFTGVLPMIIAAPFAIAALGVGTALGAAMFGADYGRDLADAVAVAVVCSLLSVGVVLAAFLLFPTTVGLVTAVAGGLAFPAIATPLFVQAFKNDAPEPTIALLSF